MNKWIDDQYIMQIFETDSDKSEWFGYYNYDVISSDGKKMLCNQVGFDCREVTREDTVDVGWYDLTTGEWHKLDTSDSFNWQQGAMLQWISGAGNENKVIYNLSRNGHFKAVICDIVTGEKNEIDFPVYCVTPDGKNSISLNYERSYWCRAYHYKSVVNPLYDVRVAQDDGIFKVDLEYNTVMRIVSIQDVIAMDEQSDFKTAKHWLEHIMLNNAGDRIAFLHRFSYCSAYRTRLFICGIDGDNLQIIDGWKDNDWSHFGWKGNRAFVIYSVKQNAFQASYAKQVQKSSGKRSLMSLVNLMVHLPILCDIKDRLKPNLRYYRMYEETDGKYNFVCNYDDKLLSIDGHPSFTADGRYMITDSYPDAEGFQRLIVFDTATKKALLLARMYAPFYGTPANCDLHPKLSNGSRLVVVDTVYTGKHKMVAFEIKWEKIKEKISC